MIGRSHEQGWYRKERNVDFFDIKGVAEGLLKGLGLHGFQFQKGKVFPGFHPEISAEILVSGSMVGCLGQMSPTVLSRFDLRMENVHLFELDLWAISDKIQESRKAFDPFVKFPAVFRDISLIVGRDVESAGIREIIEREGGELVESVTIYDVYEGKSLAPHEKALTFRICYRSRLSTLDGKEVNSLHENIIAMIGQKAGGRLREG